MSIMKRMTAEAAMVASRQAAFESWKAMALEDIQSFKTSMAPPGAYRMPAFVRHTCEWGCGPIACFSCMVWSCMARILCCCRPSAVYVHTDRCVMECYKSIHARRAPTHQCFSTSQFTGISTDQLRPVFNEFFVVMDRVQWKFHMMNWLESQLTLFGFKFDPAMLIPDQARDVVAILLAGGNPQLPAPDGQHHLGSLKDAPKI